jgi:hypothetical protein
LERYFLHVFEEVIYLLHILGKKCEGGENKKQRLGIGNCLNPPTQRSAKEIARNGHGKRSDELQNRLTRVPEET